MIPAIHVYGQAIPEGGSIELPNALARYIEAHGGTVLTDSPVSRIIVRDGRAEAIRLEDNTEIPARKAVVTTLEPAQTFLRLIDRAHLEDDFVNMVENFTFGDVASFRVHFALHEAPEFIGDELLSKAPFQRTIVPLEEIDRHFAAISIRCGARDAAGALSLLDPA